MRAADFIGLKDIYNFKDAASLGGSSVCFTTVSRAVQFSLCVLFMD